MRKSYLFLFALMLTMLGVSDAMAQKIYKAELDASMFKAWTSHETGASVTESPTYIFDGDHDIWYGCETNFYKQLEGGSVVFGNTNVYYLWYADLTGTQKISFTGTPGLQLRVLMNRPEPDGGDSHGGSTVEQRVTIGDNGEATLDLSAFEYVHLNCIKVMWGSSGIVKGIVLTGTVRPVTGILSMINNGDAEGDDLESFPCSYDGPNNWDTSSERPEIVEGEGVNGSRCFKFTAFDEPTETWHSQFYIKADEVMPKGTKWQLKMAIKADRDAIITTSAQGQPHQWKGGMLNEFSVTTDWQSFEWSGEIGVDDFQSIAFDLSNEYGAPGNAGVSFYFDNIEFGVDLGGSNPMSSFSLASGYDVIRVDLGGTTNMADLVRAASTKTLVYDNSAVSVTVDGVSFDENIISVEGYEDGNLYIFVGEDIDENSEVKVAFTNPADEAHHLIFTSGKWEGKAVPEFSGIVAPFAYDLAEAGYTSYLYGAPELVEIAPEAGSFNLPGDLKAFTLTFNQEIRVSSVVAKLGAENLVASGNGEYSKVIKLTRNSGATLTGVVNLVVSEAEGKAGRYFGLQEPVVVKYSFGPVSLDGDDQPEIIYASNFTSDGENALGAGWIVAADNGMGMQPANSGSGNRLQHNRYGYASDVLYLAQRSAVAGIALYGTVDDYKLTLEGGKTYHLTLKSAQWDSYPENGSNRSLRVQVLTEDAVSAEDGSIIDENGILAEDFKAVYGKFQDNKEYTAFDVAFTPEADGNYVIRLVSGNSDGNPAGYGDGNAIGDVKVEYIPNVLGIVETNALLAALANAKDVFEANIDERYHGVTLTALDNLIKEVEDNMASYSAPSVYTAKAEELNAAANAMIKYVALCNEYDRLPQQAFDLYVQKKDSKFVNTEYFKNLAAAVNRYCTFGYDTYFDEERGEEVTALVLMDFVKFYTTGELNRAKNELSEVVTMASKWLTEGPSSKGWGHTTTGYAAQHERIRRGVELLKSLGVADNDPLIVQAEAEFGDNDEIADAIALRAKKLILEDLAKGENSTLFRYDEESGDIPSYDLSVFFKNPNCYANAYSTEVPGWTSIQGSCFAWSSWDSSQNHSVSTPYPEDCDIHAGWHPNPYAMVEQTVTGLPAGVYVVGVKCNDNGSSWDDSGTCAFVRTSENPAIEYGDWVDRDYNFATYLTGSGNLVNEEGEGVAIEDGQLTVGFYYGNTSQAFFEEITSVKIVPLEGYNYAQAYLEFLEESGYPVEPPVVEKHNSLYIADGQRFSKTKTNMLPISLKNEEAIVGFQLDVVLPYGMTLAMDEEDYLVTTENGRAKNHSLSCNVIGDGTIRIVGTSLSNKKIASGDGLLLNMGINIASWLGNGDYAIQLKNVKFTNADMKTVTSSDKVFYVTVGGKLGDVNHDDAIDVTDAVLIIDDILLKNPANYDASLADVNSDSYIDVTDVVMVIDAILGKIELSRGAEPIDRSAYTAFQMDLTIPAGYVLESVSLTDIAKNSHSLAYAMMPDGRCRVVVCSMNNEALPGAWDEVIRLNLRGKGDAQMTIDRAVFVTIDGERHELMMNPTSIAELSTYNSQLSTRYDLQGRKVEKNAKGILLENGKKVVKK